MTKEAKELLLKDLCARLPYGVKVRIEIPFLEEGDYPIEVLSRISIDLLTINGSTIRIEDTKPYLRPLKPSEATEQERKEIEEIDNDYKSVDWLNSHHFDYRGLIEKGLALPASKEMYHESED